MQSVADGMEAASKMRLALMEKVFGVCILKSVRQDSYREFKA